MAVDKLVDSTQLDNDLTLVADAIREKGKTSDQLSFPSGFVNAIENLKTGFSLDLPDVIFYDSLANNGQGGIAYSYSASQFAQLTSMPPNPDHSNYTTHGISIPMTSHGWNWTLADAKEYVAKFGRLNIGQIYQPTDGKTHYVCYIDEDAPPERWDAQILSSSSNAYYQVDDENIIAISSSPFDVSFSSTGWHEVKISIPGGNGNFYPYNSTSPSYTYKYSAIYEVYMSLLVAPVIGNNGFSNFFNLTTITIPPGMYSIEQNSFYQCHSLRNVVFPDGVVNLGGYSFYVTVELSYVSFPKTMQNIGSYAFCYTKSLKSLTFPYLTVLQPYALEYNYGLLDIIIPDEVGLSGNSITYNFALKRITIGNVQMPAYSIQGSYGLQQIIVTDNITTVQYSFTNINSLEEVVFTNLATTIPTYMSYYANGLKKVTILSDVTQIKSYAFEYCYSLSEVVLPQSLQIIEDSAFYATSISEINFPETLTFIGHSAFYNTPLRNIQLPNSVSSIGSYAFGYTHIKDIVLPNNLTVLSEGVLYGNYNLESVTIPNSVTTINSYALSYCYSLKTITIPSSVTAIGTYAFYSNYSLAEIIIEASTPPALSNTNAFNSLPSDFKIIVPTGTRNAYISATNWNYYSSNIIEAS